MGEKKAIRYPLEAHIEFEDGCVFDKTFENLEEISCPDKCEHGSGIRKILKRATSLPKFSEDVPTI